MAMCSPSLTGSIREGAVFGFRGTHPGGLTLSRNDIVRVGERTRLVPPWRDQRRLAVDFVHTIWTHRLVRREFRNQNFVSGMGISLDIELLLNKKGTPPFVTVANGGVPFLICFY